MLRHFNRSRRTVDPDDVNAKRVDGGERGTNFGSWQHATGEFNGHLGLDWNGATGRCHGTSRPDDRGFQAEQIELRFDDEQIDAANKERIGLDFICVTEFSKANLTERRELGARAHRARHKPFSIGCRIVVGDLTCDAGIGERDLVCSFWHVILAERNGK